MSQITRCPHCQTSFRVVADQLRLAEGWVRCGQCKQIFDAFECLVDDDEAARHPASMLSLPSELTRARETELPVQPAASAGMAPSELPEAPDVPEISEVPEVKEKAPSASELQRSGADEHADAALQDWRAHVDDLADAQAAKPLRESAHQPRVSTPDTSRREPVLWPAAPVGGPDAPVPEPGIEPVWSPEPLPVPEPEPETTGSSETEPASSFLAEPESEFETVLEPLTLQDTETSSTLWAAAPLPRTAAPENADDLDFVRAARRGAFWRRPLVRLLLGLMLAALVAALGLQVALRERDTIAALYPQTHPWLELLCESLECHLAAPQRIADVAIDASSFVRERGSEPVYTLQLSVKNTAAAVVAMPAFELTLTDAQEQPVLRRVLTPAALGAPAQLAARGEWSGSVHLRVLQGAEHVSGYRLLAFYP